MNRAELSDFLKSVEKRAYKRTLFHVRDVDAALDIVQDAMIRLAEKYADRPESEWPVLFQRILSNATMDWFRRQKVRQVMTTFSDLEHHDGDEAGHIQDVLETLQSENMSESASDSLGRKQTIQMIEKELENLPTRQREAFLMRYWEEFDVAETAQAMGCTEGSVKTHCSRAIHALAKALRLKGFGR